MSNEIKIEYKDVFLFFIEEKVFPLIGLSKEMIDKVVERKSIVKSSEVFKYGQVDKQIFIKYNDENDDAFCFNLELDKDSEKLLDSIFNVFSSAAKKMIEDYLEKNKIEEKSKIRYNTFLSSWFDYVVEKGICEWVCSDNSAFERIVKILEEWSNKTYEGHSVSYGILFDCEGNSGDNGDQLFSFLRDEYSAVLSDGITSMIEVDKKGNFVDYHSIIEDNKIDMMNISEKILPYRFVQIIDKYVEKTKVGVFLLFNGDIIIAKNKEIYFIKRNGHWLNFKYEAFKRNLLSRQKKKYSDVFLRNLYVTMLDVSLAHTGGIISVIDYDKNKIEKEFLTLIDNIKEEYNDNKLNEDFLEKYINASTYNETVIVGVYKKLCEYKDESLTKTDLEKYLKTHNVVLKVSESHNTTFQNFKNYLEKNDSFYSSAKHDHEKRLVKRRMLIKLTNNKKFVNLDHKLRAELIGMDGACILDKEGNVISFGAIIQNDPGSSGGGRGAAAKKLSRYGGFAIKISTDGYIEIYDNEKRIYSIK